MIKTRATFRPATGAMALAAGFLFLAPATLAPAASAQVLGSSPYAPAPDPAMDAMRNRLDAAEAELRRVTGRNEQLGFELTQTRRQVEEINTERMRLAKALEDVTARLAALERLARGDEDAAAEIVQAPAEATISLLPSSGPAAAASASATSEAALVDVSQLPQDDAGLLREARNLLLEGRYVSAEAAFGHYLKIHARTAGAHEAQYMLGESLLYQGEYAAAADAYGKLLSDYPNSSFGPMGLVKLARSMRLMDKKPEACRALGLMSQRFPRAPAEARELAATERQRAGC